MTCGINRDVREYRCLKSAASKVHQITEQGLSTLNSAKKFGI